mgnify:CR=1 FL=1
MINPYSQYSSHTQSNIRINPYPSEKAVTPLKLPQIGPQLNPSLAYMRDQQMERAYGFVNNRLSRSINTNPFQNYPLYPNDMQNFYNNYPQSLFYYRPIRYFYQRPVQLDADNCFPHQKKILNQLKERDDRIRGMLDKRPVKYGIPKKMDDVIKSAEVVHYPKASLVSTIDLKKKEKEYAELKKKLEKLGPEGLRKRRKRNRELKNIMRRIVLFNDFVIMERDFTKAATNLRRDHFTYIQAAKANINEIKNFVLRLLHNIENFCVQFFAEKITIVTDNEKLHEDSVFVVKSFIHQLYNDLSSAFVNSDDLPKSIRAIFKEFIREKAQLSPGFLSTFEFNRLEFDVRCRLNNMNKPRRALIIGFLVFYRALICEIFKNYLTYFPKIREMGNPIKDVLNKKIRKINPNIVNGYSRRNISSLHPELQKEVDKLNNKKTQNDKDIDVIDKFNGPDADTQILYYKRRKMEIRNNLLFNFNFIIQILDHILRRAFKANPPVYNDFFKNKHLYNLMVFSPEMNRKRQLITSLDNDDDIEFMNGIYTPSEDAEVFLRDNQRWMHMYELSTIELCGDLATKILDDEIPKISKGFSLNNNKYMINKPDNNAINLNNNKSNEDEDKKSRMSNKSKMSKKSKISAEKEKEEDKSGDEKNKEDNKKEDKKEDKKDKNEIKEEEDDDEEEEEEDDEEDKKNKKEKK